MISLNNKDLPTCFCGTHENVKATYMFGYLDFDCKSCGRHMSTGTRSGSLQFLLDELTPLWEEE